VILSLTEAKVMRAVIVVLLGLGATLAGCGPSALEQRVCEMWGDEGGSNRTVAEWLEYFSQPEQVAQIEASNAQWRAIKTSRWREPGLDNARSRLHATPQSRAQEQYDYGQAKNQEAKARASLRLSISLREVDEALKKCPGAKPAAVQPESK
jgi:hypothetical protein